MVPAVPSFYFPMCYCEYGKEMLGNCLRNKQPHEWKIEWKIGQFERKELVHQCKECHQ